MSLLIAWRILIYEKGRNMLAMAGIFIAVVMIFLQLGFYASVPEGGMQVYNHMRFDLLMTSSAYVAQSLPYDFPRQRLYQALSLPEVESVAPFYQAEVAWLNQEEGVRRDLFVMAFKPTDNIFTVPDIEGRLDVIQRPDTVLVDTTTKPIFGPQTSGRRIEIGERSMEIGGRFVLGIGFFGLGGVVTSDLNFLRIFPYRSLATVTLGLVRLKPGSSPDQVAGRLREVLPADTRVFTRPELEANDSDFWKTHTSTGIVFGFGVIISIVVGLVILYQTLATQVTRQLPQYATLKAMGYADAFLLQVVVGLAMVMASLAFIPAFAAAVAIYAKVRTMTPLPVEMTVARVAGVFGISVAMSAGSALIAARILRRADPADLF